MNYLIKNHEKKPLRFEPRRLVMMPDARKQSRRNTQWVRIELKPSE